MQPCWGEKGRERPQDETGQKGFGLDAYERDTRTFPYSERARGGVSAAPRTISLHVQRAGLPATGLSCAAAFLRPPFFFKRGFLRVHSRTV